MLFYNLTVPPLNAPGSIVRNLLELFTLMRAWIVYVYKTHLSYRLGAYIDNNKRPTKAGVTPN